MSKSRNPWMDISLSDYINHMSNPEVRQYQMINEHFKKAVTKHEPRSIFVPGCTIGNGFEHIDWEKIENVLAVDISSSFIEELKNQYGSRKNLELIAGDIQKISFDKDKYDLIFAALIFEYVDVSMVLQKISNIISEKGILYVILQQAGNNQSLVSKTKYKSLEILTPVIKLITPDQFRIYAAQFGMIESCGELILLNSGKSFYAAEYKKSR
ncbi:MAG: class I SAM-dependent methyltransferase [Melioribacteraceae bacterium]|nr:class I SAM-dependent methyltransferase [Melioribacteraceae bacterium]MCF8356430.1 class I SAM-dependent methyltransferase [Melioribacteraceae bacterium]MCF8395785.1 class I SAM-dependent methyltransferase [Melioribacteraceae bacterium]MCF8420914.1 class I SAM-dependent methyltransferase [Melioribacteraceae bacterium]